MLIPALSHTCLIIIMDWCPTYALNCWHNLFIYFFLFCQKANPICSVLKEDIRDETDEYVDVHKK
jgi:hypothetical protein